MTVKPQKNNVMPHLYIKLFFQSLSCTTCAPNPHSISFFPRREKIRDNNNLTVKIQLFNYVLWVCSHSTILGRVCKMQIH